MKNPDPTGAAAANGIETDPAKAFPILAREREGLRGTKARFAVLCYVEFHNMPVLSYGETVGHVAQAKVPALVWLSSGGDKFAVVVREGSIYVLTRDRWSQANMAPLKTVRQAYKAIGVRLAP